MKTLIQWLYCTFCTYFKQIIAAVGLLMVKWGDYLYFLNTDIIIKRLQVCKRLIFFSLMHLLQKSRVTIFFCHAGLTSIFLFFVGILDFPFWRETFKWSYWCVSDKFTNINVNFPCFLHKFSTLTRLLCNIFELMCASHKQFLPEVWNVLIQKSRGL